MISIRRAIVDDAAVLAEFERCYVNEELGTAYGARLEGQALSETELQCLIASGLIAVACDQGKIIAYAITGKWDFFKRWTLFDLAIKRLRAETGIVESESCYYGPVWVDQKYRRRGICRALFNWLKQHLSGQFAAIVTLVAEENEASFCAHVAPGYMQVADFFECDDRGYYLLQQPL